MKVLKDLKDGAQELLDLGNSREHARGYGMLEATLILEKYVLGCEIFLTLLDTDSKDEQKILKDKLIDLGLL